MTDSVPAIALLFDDVELGAQLREVLQERGAQIVHEGGVSTLNRSLLEQLGADVLVVNLDDSAEELDHLYDMIDGERPRIVFNDAQASKALTGWDRARWARHLAVKVLAAGEIDPPRPSHAQGLEMPSAEAADVASIADNNAAPADLDPAPEEAAEPAGTRTQPATDVSDEFDASLSDGESTGYGQKAAAQSESLAAELEAMLASGDLPEADDELSGGLRYANGEEPPPLHDGDFGERDAESGPMDFTEDDPSVEQAPAFAAEPLAQVEPPVFQTDHLQLSALTDAAVATIPAGAAEPAIVDDSTPVQAPDGWALVDEDAAAEIEPEPTEAQTFGIEKLSAADFLAPDVESVDDSIVPTMSLELESIEQAIAPKDYVQDHEMVLDDLGSALSRLVVLGAAVDGLDSVCEFLAALPARTRLTFLHTQHLGDHADAAVVDRFAANCALPVRLAVGGSIAGAGEVLVVPAGQQVRLRRDGRIELQSSGSDAALGPSIDISLTMAAGAFGRDALAIVFAGRGNDAVAGAQAIHDRGGPVWVESSSGEHFADMVSGIFAERLVSFSGTPTELAAHLIEVFP